MAPRPVIEKRKEEYAQVLEKFSILLVTVRRKLTSEHFTSYSRMVREANSLREVRKICAEVREEFLGTTGGIREAYVIRSDGDIDREASHAYDAALQEVWKYSCPL
ncbi:hypothetical protein, partial [Rathayibacter toxicus]|uniref:hypothetical protein n=1 Tax=Rathayibacter toxicus TaxID=145458 RepID=UPI001CA5437D